METKTSIYCGEAPEKVTGYAHVPGEKKGTGGQTGGKRTIPHACGAEKY